MYGAFTVLIATDSKITLDWFNGKGRMLQEDKNTSFSAVGHLRDRDGTTTVTCDALDGKTHTLAKLPELPYEHCTCALGCRCLYFPDLGF
jgi:hypothetical protein